MLKKTKKAILVDTARPNDLDNILLACRQVDVQLLFLTHTHMDHCQNAAAIAKELHIPIEISRLLVTKVFPLEIQRCKHRYS